MKISLKHLRWFWGVGAVLNALGVVFNGLAAAAGVQDANFWGLVNAIGLLCCILVLTSPKGRDE